MAHNGLSLKSLSVRERLLWLCFHYDCSFQKCFVNCGGIVDPCNERRLLSLFILSCVRYRFKIAEWKNRQGTVNLWWIVMDWKWALNWKWESGAGGMRGGNFPWIWCKPNLITGNCNPPERLWPVVAAVKTPGWLGCSCRIIWNLTKNFKTIKTTLHFGIVKKWTQSCIFS